MRWVLDRGFPVRNHSGEVYRIAGIAEDITERKQAEETVVQQLSLLQTLIDRIPTPIFYKDTEGRYQGCNSSFESFIGLSKADILGKTVYEIAPEDLADIYREADLALSKEPGVQQYETSIRYADGTRRNVLFSKGTLTDIDGSVAGLVGVIVDITERKQAEDALRESEERYRELFSTISDAIIIFDADTRQFIDMNASALRLYGYTRDELAHPDNEYPTFLMA